MERVPSQNALTFVAKNLVTIVTPSPRTDKTEESCPRASFGARVGRSSCEACRFKCIIGRAQQGVTTNLSSGESGIESGRRSRSREIVVALFKLWVVGSVASVGNNFHKCQKSASRAESRESLGL